MELHFHYLYVVIIALLVVCMLASLVRTIIGPRRADRIMGVNMVGSLSTIALAILSVLLKESWLLDVCLVYCLISFLTVVILAKLHIGEGMESASKEMDKEEDRYE